MTPRSPLQPSARLTAAPRQPAAAPAGRPAVAPVGWLLVPPLLATLMCLGHALYCYALLTGLLPEQSLAGLAYVPGAAVARAAQLQHLQLLVAGGGLAGFVACTAFLLLRSHALLRECRRRAAASAPFLRGLPVPLAGLAPEPRAGSAGWLLPIWWGLLLAAAGCAAMGLLRLQVPGLTVGEWRVADYWLMAAHGLFLGFFLLSRRLLQHLEGLQRACWQCRDAARARRAGAAGIAFGPSAG